MQRLKAWKKQFQLMMLKAERFIFQLLLLLSSVAMGIVATVDAEVQEAGQLHQRLTVNLNEKSRMILHRQKRW